MLDKEAPQVGFGSLPNLPRSISLSTTSSRHPLNVKPSGNLILQTSSESDDTSKLRSAQLGSLAILPDDLVMDLLGYVASPRDLHQLSLTSRFMYAFCYDEDMWKKLYVSLPESEREKLQWKGSWRCTSLGIELLQQCNLQIRGNFDLCSDTLYRPFQCSQIDNNKLFGKIALEEEKYHFLSINNPDLKLDELVLPPGRIPRIPEALMTIDEFSQWHNKPFIITNGDKSRWPSWDLQNLLGRFPDVKFRQEAVQWSLSLYAQYLAENRDESPLYLFDCNSDAMKTLKGEYDPPAIFKEDLFKIFNKTATEQESSYNCRPDHAWLIVGPKRSGSTFHKDPNYTSAWNAAITGRKLWIMLPGDITPPGVGTDEEELEVTSPVGIAEWCILGFFNDCLKIDQCQIGITFPGEVMYVPSGWWHSVINLDNSVALTQNFVPPLKLSNALNFLKNKRDQVSGFRPMEIRDTIEKILLKTTEETENTKILKSFLSDFLLDELLLNEDCGEIENLPSMPIFELFSELMIRNGMQDDLNEGLNSLQRLEKANQGPGKSEVWEKLQEEKSSGFSFGFGFEESDDED